MPRAIITGASAGIGQALARRLAREGYDLLLVARREDRLRELAQALEREHKVKAEVLALDVTAADAPERLLAAAGDADLLVNNAGFGKHGSATSVSLEHSAGMVRLNCESLTSITRAFLPGMLERKRGTILNVGSIAGFQPLPFEAVYGASKAYVNAFSVALDAETKPQGVRVLVLCPGPVPTEFQQIANSPLEHAPAFLRVSAEQVADEAWWMIRTGRRKWVPNGFLRLFMFLETFVPQSIIVGIAARIMKPKPHLLEAAARRGS